jgi:hypothetical protein
VELPSSGVNSVIGNVHGSTDPRDFLALTIPDGFQLSGLTLASYTSLDSIGFIGVQAGGTFNSDLNDPAHYLGYTHIGPGAGNVGADILSDMGDNQNVSFGSQGFTTPLLAGTYSFVIQQANANATAYQFDFQVAPIPEPRAQAAVAALCVISFLARQRLKRPV